MSINLIWTSVSPASRKSRLHISNSNSCVLMVCWTVLLYGGHFLEIQRVPVGLAKGRSCMKLFCNVITFLVTEPFEETEEKWLSSLENTHWLEYIRFVSLIKCCPKLSFQTFLPLERSLQIKLYSKIMKGTDESPSTLSLHLVFCVQF